MKLLNWQRKKNMWGTLGAGVLDVLLVVAVAITVIFKNKGFK